jgi:hypothetical protein
MTLPHAGAASNLNNQKQMFDLDEHKVKEIADRIYTEREELRDIAQELGTRLRSKLKYDLNSTPADRAALLQLDMVLARVYRTDFGI